MCACRREKEGLGGALHPDQAHLLLTHHAHPYSPPLQLTHYPNPLEQIYMEHLNNGIMITPPTGFPEVAVDVEGDTINMEDHLSEGVSKGTCCWGGWVQCSAGGAECSAGS